MPYRFPYHALEFLSLRILGRINKTHRLDEPQFFFSLAEVGGKYERIDKPIIFHTNLSTQHCKKKMGGFILSPFWRKITLLSLPDAVLYGRLNISTVATINSNSIRGL